MNILKHFDIDCETYADVARKQGVVVTQIAEMADVPHVGFDGVAKSQYVSPKTGNTIFVLERSGQYAPDAFATEVWLTEDDFSEEDAVEFVKAHDLQRESEKRIQHMIRTFKRYPAATVQEESWTSDPSGEGLSPEEFAEAKRRYEKLTVKKAKDLQVGDLVMVYDSGVFQVLLTIPKESINAPGRFLQYTEFGGMTNPLPFPVEADIDVITE